MKIIGAVDIGGTKTAVGAVTETGAIVSRLQDATAPEKGFALAMQRIQGMLRDVAARTGSQFEGIGIACPGPLDPFSGIIGEVGTLPGWQGGNLVERLSESSG